MIAEVRARIAQALAGGSRMEAAAAIGDAMRGLGTGITLKGYFDNMATADAWKRGLDVRPGAQDGGITDPYRQSGPYKRGVDIISDALASVPWKLYRRAKKLTNEVETGPVYELFRMPNPLLSRTQLFQATVVYLKRDGKCVWYYDKITGKMPGEIWPLNPRCLKATKDDRGMLTGWMWKTTGAKVETLIPLDRASYFKQFNPDDISDGMPDVTGGLIDIEQEYFAKTFMSSVFRNGSELGNIFTTDKTPGEDVARRMLEMLAMRHAGPGKARKDILLEGGFKVERSGTAPKDMEFSQLQRHTREETLGNLGVPPMLAGVMEYANYANGRVQERIFWNNAVLPILHHVEDMLDSTFFARYAPDMVGQFDVDDIAALKEDTGEKIGWGKILFDMGVPPNVINELLDIGWDPKHVPWGDDVLVPFNMITAREAVKQTALDLQPDVTPAAPAPPAPDATPAKSHENREDDQAAQSGRFALAIARKDDPNPRFAASFLKTEEVRARYWKGAIRTLIPIERGYKGKLGTYFATQGRGVLGSLLARGKMLRGVVKEAVDQEVEAILFDMEEEGAKLRVLSRPYFRESMKVGAARILADIDVGDPWKVDNPRAQALLAKQLTEVVGINDTTRDALRATLTEGFGKGEALSDLAGRVRAVYDVAGASRSRTIARTEIGQAANSAGFEALQDAGVQKHEWLSARDSAVRDDHAPGTGADGEIVTIGENFPIVDIPYPQAPQGRPEQVINCFPAGTVIEGRVISGIRAEYIGPMIEITTWSGRRLTVTPNHPVLTPDGFAPAGTLHEGSKVLCRGGYVKASPLREDQHDAPAPIEQIFDAVSARGTRLSKLAARHDLDGDGEFLNGQIDIVLLNRELEDRLDASLVKSDGQFTLVDADLRPGSEASDGSRAQALDGRGATSDRSPRLFELSANLLGIGAQRGPLHELRFGSASQFDASRYEPGAYGTTRDAGLIGELLEGRTVPVAIGEIGQIRDQMNAPVSCIDSGTTEGAVQRRSADASTGGDVSESLAGSIAIDEIRKVREFHYSGHVYDLESPVGWILADGIVCRQCRCIAIPAIE